MSSFQIILLSIFGALAAAGILIFAFLVGTNSDSTIGAVQIWGPFDETAVQTVIRQLSEEDNRLRQVTYVQKNPETFEAELTNALASGTGPDLFFLRSDHTILDAPKIAPIPYESFSAEQFESVFVEAARPFLSETGVLAVPLTVDPMLLYWNRDMLSVSGFAQPPLYWDELFGMARTITDCQRVTASQSSVPVGCDETRTIKKATVALGTFENITNAKQIISLLMLQAGSPITARDSAGQLSPTLSPRQGGISQPAESAVAFYTSFADPSRDSYSWNNSFASSQRAFADGDLALYIGLASEYPLIRRLNPNLNFAVAPVPQVRNLETSVNTGFAYGLAVPKAAQNPGGALTTAYLLASSDASRMLSVVFGHSSARRDVLASGAQGLEDVVNRQTLITRTWEDPHPEETTRIFRDMITAITSGASKVTESLQRAEQAMRQLPL